MEYENKLFPVPLEFSEELTIANTVALWSTEVKFSCQLRRLHGLACCSKDRSQK